ncbi:DUF977 family protein [Salmonella enterica]|nr:DNA-binding protein [Salmonella enterica]EHQ9353401.1 DUF977 family protein [Salmonella enterica]EHR1669729.1 DUF977 family protein [Salmonella enterica]EHR8096112.1 DUF977 family protein [Salmonella enterica]EIE9497398.1 DUF977 family protein [Salmonella enterica]
MSMDYVSEGKVEIQKRLTDLVHRNGRMTLRDLRMATGLTTAMIHHYLEKARGCGDLYLAGKSGIFPSERDFLIWKQERKEAREEHFLNAPVNAGVPYDRSRNSVCEECRNSYVMQRVLVFYRGYQGNKRGVGSK